MHIGVPKEIKNNEYRVAIVPSIVRELIDHGHRVFIETNAGNDVDLSDKDYQEAGATILNSAQEVFEQKKLYLPFCIWPRIKNKLNCYLTRNVRLLRMKQ